MISTTHGDMDESLLTKKEGVVEDTREYTVWTEYYMGDELVHRSAHVTLKIMPQIFSDAAKLG